MSQRQAGYVTRKYHEPLDDALDRPIAFNPAFKRITGSTVAALMLSQAWYWSKRTSDNDGWFYKTIEEWEEETGLTRSEQETARKHLKRFLEVDLRGVPATLYYRLNKQEIYDSLGVQFAETPQTSLQEPRILVSDIPANINRNTENTTENMPIPWKIAHGQPVTQEELDAEGKRDAAIMQFERAFGTGKWPWWSNTVWERFARFVIAVYEERPLAFGEYVAWRAGPGKYAGYSNKKIRQSPAEFMDTGWPEFAATLVTNSQPATPDPDGGYR